MGKKLKIVSKRSLKQYIRGLPQTILNKSTIKNLPMLEGLQCLAWRLCFLVMIKNEWRVCCRRSNIDAVNCVNWRPFLFQNYTYSNKKSWNVSCSTALFVSSSALFQLPAHLQNLKWRTRIPNGGWKRVLITLGAKEFFLFCSFSSAWLCNERWLTNPSIFC